GDLHLRHVLVDGSCHATGVIDWGDLCRGDPACDLAFAFMALRGRPRSALLAAYGPVSPATALRARAIALRIATMLALHAHAEGDGALRAEALAAVGRATT
ncbi:MAG TPA: phosphotransferase, partial [Miltoncostaeaceae bacterium]|nr:phosphotransferase [Miltoncostaeaceae bacterium]